MVITGRVEYDGRVFTVISVNMMVYIVISPSVIIIIIIIVVIILSRDVVIISLFFVWLCVGYFWLQSVKNFQINRGFPRKPLEQLVNTSGELQGGPHKAGDYAASVGVEELVGALDVYGGAKRHHFKCLGIHGFPLSS